MKNKVNYDITVDDVYFVVLSTRRLLEIVSDTTELVNPIKALRPNFLNTSSYYGIYSFKMLNVANLTLIIIKLIPRIMTDSCCRESS